jgi:hypothetical protein
MNWDSKTIAKVFNSNVLNDIANGDFSYIEKIASQNFISSSDTTIRAFYDHAYSYLRENYRNEYFYKNLIVNKILIGRHSLNTATMLPEFRVGSNKADCVILNGKSTCYEIKTDYDSLIRLDDQLSSYLQLFDEVYVVCSIKYQQAVLEIAPLDVGILILTEKQTFSQYRKATPRKIPINKKLLMQSLRQHEYKELAERLTGESVNFPNTLIYNECFSILERYSDDYLLNKYLIQILKKSRKNNDRLIESLPESLANAAISYRFKKGEVDTLIKYFKEEEGLHVLSNLKREVE